MGGSARWLALGGATLCALALGVVSAPQGLAAAQPPPVSPVPAAGTPALVPSGTTEQVRQLMQCGGIAYLVFGKVRPPKPQRRPRLG
jgi:hypothetical protein